MTASVSTSTPEIKTLIVCTKAYDAANAITGLLSRLRDTSNVVLLNNGIGVKEQIDKVLSKAALRPHVLEGFLSHGVYPKSADTICHAGRGDFLLSSASKGSPRTEDLAALSALFKSLDAVALDYSTFKIRQLEKLLVNAVINPVTAIGDFKNGCTAQYPKLIDAILREALTILSVAYPDLTLDHNDVRSTIDTVIQRTSNNRSSMLQDISSSRRTEVDYINGALCSLAQRHQLPSPLNSELVKLVDERTHGSTSKSAFQKLLSIVGSRT